MYAQVEKPKENNNRAVANIIAQKKNNVKQGFGFVDQREQSVQILKLSKAISTPNAEVIQAVWQNANNWQQIVNLANVPKTVVYGIDFAQNHLRTHQVAHATDMNVYAERYAGAQGAYGGRNTMLWAADIAAAMGAMNFANQNVIIGYNGTNKFEANIALPSLGFEWGPLNPNNVINQNNVRLDVRNSYNNAEVWGYVRGNRNQQGQYTQLEFKVTHLESAW